MSALDFYVGKPDPALPHDKRLPILDQNTPEGSCAIDAFCVHQCLDDREVPRQLGANRLSLWGRVCEYVRQEEQKRSSNE